MINNLRHRFVRESLNMTNKNRGLQIYKSIYAKLKTYTNVKRLNLFTQFTKVHCLIFMQLIIS